MTYTHFGDLFSGKNKIQLVSEDLLKNTSFHQEIEVVPSKWLVFEFVSLVASCSLGSTS